MDSETFRGIADLRGPTFSGSSEMMEQDRGLEGFRKSWESQKFPDVSNVHCCFTKHGEFLPQVLVLESDLRSGSFEKFSGNRGFGGWRKISSSIRHPGATNAKIMSTQLERRLNLEL